MKRLLIVLIICMSFVILSSIDIINNKEVIAKDCKCRIMVECYYPGYESGIDLPFASKIVYSCEEAEEYMQRISQKIQKIGYPDDWMKAPAYSREVFFFLYPAKS